MARRTSRRFGRIHEAKVERWLGEDCLDTIKVASAGVPGFAIPIAGMPAAAYDGMIVEREPPVHPEFTDRVFGMTGFVSLSDLIAEATTGGKKQQIPYAKTGVAAPAVAASQSLWAAGTLPAAGANAAGTPGGTVPTRATAGSLGQLDPTGSDTLHLTTWTGLGTVVGSLMLYDYLWGVNINHATTANTVTGTATRQIAATTAPGNFLSGRVTTVLNATAHNATITYVDDQGAAAEAGSAQAIRVSSAVQTAPFTAPQWTYSLNSPDMGLRNVTSIALSAAATGNIDWFIGHPFALLPLPVANIPFILDGINSAFNLVKIEVGACLAFNEFFKPATTAGTFSGTVEVCAG